MGKSTRRLAAIGADIKDAGDRAGHEPWRIDARGGDQRVLKGVTNLQPGGAGKSLYVSLRGKTKVHGRNAKYRWSLTARAIASNSPPLLASRPEVKACLSKRPARVSSAAVERLHDADGR